VPFQSRFTRTPRDEPTARHDGNTNSEHQTSNGQSSDSPVPGTHRLSQEHASLAREIQNLATSLDEIDSRSSSRLRDLASAVSTPNERSRWNAVDLQQAFNLERIAYEFAVRRVGRQKVQLIEFADKIRNMLVLVPVFLTWFALAEAARDYERFVSANPDQAGQPFLLLWQQGFGGESSPISPTFATVALIDAAVILVIIFLTFYAHGRREDQEDAVANVAQEFHSGFDNVLAEAGVLLARDRAAQPSQLARNVAALTDRFDQNSREILELIGEERERLAAIADQRHEEFQDFAVFARSMRGGAEQSNRMLAELRQLSRSLDNTVDRLSSDVAATGRHQGTLLSTLQNLEQLTSSAIQSDQAVTHRLAEAAAAISESADAAATGADNANRLAEVANQTLRGIGELAQRVADTSDELARATNRDHSSAQELGASVARTTEQNQQIADALSGLTQDIDAIRSAFGDLANRSATQARTLNQLIELQGGIAQEITRATRALGAAGMSTAQRNREAREDLTRLAQRLEQLTTALNRAAQQAPTTETLQKAFAGAIRSSIDVEHAVEEGRSTRRWNR
jgi:ABC-type transporter Mla subunit MlaD